MAVDGDAGLARITISDNGAGIPPEQLADIFTLFVSTKGARGTGLGLTVSRKILREHGGDIHATSRAGAGSTFALEFPLRLEATGGPEDALMEATLQTRAAETGRADIVR